MSRKRKRNQLERGFIKTLDGRISGKSYRRQQLKARRAA